MNDLLERFKNHKYFQRIFNISDDIIIIFLSGSRISGIVDEYSDYDICVFTPHFQMKDCFQRIQANTGEIIHWYYNSIETISGSSFIKEDKNFGLMLVYFLEQEHILYLNPTYKNWINCILKNKIEIARHQAMIFYKYMLPTIYTFINYEFIPTNMYKKNIYQLCLTYYILLNKPIETEFLKRIKRIRYQEVQNNDVLKAYNMILELHNYCQSLNYNYKMESERLYNMLLEALPGDE